MNGYYGNTGDGTGSAITLSDSYSSNSSTLFASTKCVNNLKTEVVDAKASLSGATFTGNVTTLGSFGTPVAVSGTAIDLSLGTVFTKTITGTTTFTFTNAVSAKSNCFSLILTNGGNYTVNWPGTVLWAGDEAPELTTSGKDVVTFLTPDGGTTWYGVPSVLDAQ